MPSPYVTINGNSQINGVNVSAGSTVTIALLSTAGVVSWSLECTSSNDLVNQPIAAVNATLVVNQINKTATFTMPNAVSCLIFTSIVNNGINNNGVSQASYTSTFEVNVVGANSQRLFCVGETTEDDIVNGWTSKFNYIAENYTSTSEIVSGDLSGNLPDPTVVGLQGNPISATPPVADTYLRYDGDSWEADNVDSIQGFSISATTPTSGQFLIYNGSQWNPTGPSITIPAGSAFSLSQTTQASDIATNSLNISAQAPFASATGTHRTPGSINFNLAQPSNSGTSRGHVNFIDNATTLMTVFGDASGDVEISLSGNAIISGAGTLTLTSNTINAPCVNLGFYNGTTAVAQATRAGQLVDSTGGTPSGTLAAFTGSVYATDSPTIKNSISSLAAKLNALELIIHQLGLSQ